MWAQIDRLKRMAGLGSGVEKLALVLSGGGARAAYQAGVLKYITEHISADYPEIITGVSAGSINAAKIANDLDSFDTATQELISSWTSLTNDDVYTAASSLKVFMNIIRRSSDSDQELLPRAGLVNTDPMRDFLKTSFDAPDGRLTGIPINIKNGRLSACAFVSTDYATGQTVTWLEGESINDWKRPNRLSRNTELTIEHIMASTSLPFLFPAVPLEDSWYGDGGIRQADPLSPAVHLGATKILAISTRYDRSQAEADVHLSEGYPPAAQIFGVLLSAVFLDRLDQDALILERNNRLIRHLAPWRRNGLREIDLCVIRPSIDLGKLSGDFQYDLDGVLGLIARGLGSEDTKSPDWLSMILFDSAYTSRLIEVGYTDGKAQRDRLLRFFDN